MDDDALYNFFSECGEIDNCRVYDLHGELFLDCLPEGNLEIPWLWIRYVQGREGLQGLLRDEWLCRYLEAELILMGRIARAVS